VRRGSLCEAREEEISEADEGSERGRRTTAVQITEDALGVLAEGALGIGVRSFKEKDDRAGAAE
jgi:hypothetical protein